MVLTGSRQRDCPAAAGNFDDMLVFPSPSSRGRFREKRQIPGGKITKNQPVIPPGYLGYLTVFSRKIKKRIPAC